MDKTKEFKHGVVINIGLMIAFLAFGFCYPDIFSDTLDDLLWHGEDSDIFVFGLLGTIAFIFSGGAVSAVVKHLTNGKASKTSTSTIVWGFFTLGASYMALRIMSTIEGYGIIGKVAIEVNELEVVKPVSIVFLAVSVYVIISQVYTLCANYAKMSAGDVSSPRRIPPETVVRAETNARKTAGEIRRHDKEEHIEKKTVVNSELEKSSKKCEESSRIKPAGDL